MVSSHKDINIKDIQGNAPDETKAAVADALSFFTLSRHFNEVGFADAISQRIKVVEVRLGPQENSLKKTKTECVVTSELDVQNDMTSALRIMHGGCTSFLMDICTSLPLVALTGPGSYAGVTLSLTINFHAPAPLGSKLRIIARSIAVGGRTMTSRGEIWDTTNSRLLATGTHMKMVQTETKPKL
ncbi:hypothetical protein Clacol_008296 [Clathrus columnatus]|uniref:Thioesterase domain-containing protein n=1 Tax=Clathrus columnatus TaxID=1419009 RepID=A0AAV5AHD6_9AGAM|nr:hypothetical protein Clacol_008296 [Clathrus columnatus]